jgi:hypothetical protein
VTIRELPIACSLDGETRATREEEWSEFLDDTLIERHSIDGGVALRLKPSPHVASGLRQLIESEQRCCPWIRWAVNEGDLSFCRGDFF